jgi:hypothetical protein
MPDKQREDEAGRRPGVREEQGSRSRGLLGEVAVVAAAGAGVVVGDLE